MKWVGILVVAAVFVVGVAHFSGAVDFGFSANVTEQGKEMADSGISKVQDGLDHLKSNKE